MPTLFQSILKLNKLSIERHKLKFLQMKRVFFQDFFPKHASILRYHYDRRWGQIFKIYI